MLRVGARAVTLVGIFVGVLGVRVVSESRGEFGHAELARERGDIPAAIVGYRRAARWYAPGNPYGVRALEGIEEIAREAETAGDPELALRAWRAERGAILAGRSFFIPYPQRRARAEAAIVRLLTEGSPAAAREETREGARASFQRPLGPNILWTLLLLLGWIAWTGGAFLFAQRAFDAEDAVRGTAARRLGTVVVVGFGLFVVGMALA